MQRDCLTFNWNFFDRPRTFNRNKSLEMSFAKAINNQHEPTNKQMVGRVDEVIQKVPAALNRINAKNSN